MVASWRQQQRELAGKRRELLREVVRALRRLAIVAYAGNPGNLPELCEARTAAEPDSGFTAVRCPGSECLAVGPPGGTQILT
jgi:hypothetical protein